MATSLLVAMVFCAVIDWWARWRHRESVEVVSKPLTTVLVIALALVAGADTVQTVIAVVALLVAGTIASDCAATYPAGAAVTAMR